MTELKPCPFCGGEAYLVHRKEDDTWLYFCGCLDCGVETIGGRKKKTIKEWNSRAEIKGELSPSPWHTETPTEEGDYLVAVDYSPVEGIQYEINRYVSEPYNDFIYATNGKIVAWQKIEPYKAYKEES